MGHNCRYEGKATPWRYRGNLAVPQRPSSFINDVTGWRLKKSSRMSRAPWQLLKSWVEHSRLVGCPQMTWVSIYEQWGLQAPLGAAELYRVGCERVPELHNRSPSSSSPTSSSQPPHWARPIHQVSRICIRGIAPAASFALSTSHPSKLGLPLVNRDSPKMFSLVYAAIAHEAAPNELPSA